MELNKLNADYEVGIRFLCNAMRRIFDHFKISPIEMYIQPNMKALVLSIIEYLAEAYLANTKIVIWKIDSKKEEEQNMLQGVGYAAHGPIRDEPMEMEYEYLTTEKQLLHDKEMAVDELIYPLESEKRSSLFNHVKIVLDTEDLLSNEMASYMKLQSCLAVYSPSLEEKIRESHFYYREITELKEKLEFVNTEEERKEIREKIRNKF